MNSDSPKTPREEMEAWLTSLLLGELSEGEAAAVRELMKHDAELAKLHDRLQQSISLVRETVPQMDAPPAESLKLSAEKRQRLLTAFKIPPLKKEHQKRKPFFQFTVVEVLVVVAIIGILAAMLLPALSKSKSRAHSVAVRSNLRQIELAKQLWADDNKKSTGDAPTAEDLRPYLGGRGEIQSVGGEKYVWGKVGEPVAAEIDATEAKKRFGRLPATPAQHESEVAQRVRLSSDGTLAYAKKGAGTLTLFGSEPAKSPPAFGAQTATSRPQTPSNVHSLNVVGYVNVDASRLSAVTATGGSTAAPTTPWATYYSANGSSAASTPGIVAATPPPPVSAEPVVVGGNVTAHFAVPALRPTIVLPSEKPGDASGYAIAATAQPQSGRDWLDNGRSAAAGDSAPADAKRYYRLKADEFGAGAGGGGNQGGDRPAEPTLLYDFATTPLPQTATEELADTVRLQRQPSVDPATGLPVPLEQVLREEIVLNDDAKKTPIFGDLPSAGKLFRSEDKVSGAAGQDAWKFQAPSQSLAAVPAAPEAETIPLRYSDGVDSFTTADFEAPKQPARQPVTRGSDVSGPVNLGEQFGYNLNGGTLITTNAIVANGTVTEGTEALGPYGANQFLGGARRLEEIQQQKGVATDNWYGANKVVAHGAYDPSVYYRELSQLGDEKNLALDDVGGRRSGDRVDALSSSSTIVLPTDSAGNSGDRLITGGLRPPPQPSKPARPDVALSIAGKSESEVSRALEREGKDLFATTPYQKRGNVSQSEPVQTFSGGKSIEADLADPAPSMVLEAETLRRMNGQLTESKGRLRELQVVKDKLSVLNKEELKQVFPRAATDARRNELLSQQMTVLANQEKAAKAGVDALEKTVSEAQKLDVAQVEKARPYFEAKRELDQLVNFGRVLDTKLASERIDLALPRTTTVDFVEHAQPAKEKTGFWRSLGAPVGGEFASAARIKLEPDLTDIEGLAGSRSTGMYDPYFIQTELETIQSEAVLGKVVDSLGLDKAWKKKGAGEKLAKAEAIKELKQKLDLKSVGKTSLVEIRGKSDSADEAAKIANAVAEAYKDHRQQQRTSLITGGIKALDGRYQDQADKIREAQIKVDRLRDELKISDADAAGIVPPPNIPAIETDAPPIRKPSTNAPIPQPEIQTSENNFSTFSLNVSDVSFKLAAASLEKGQMPDAASVRSEEFINTFDYRDPEAAAGAPIAFAYERARYPFAHNRDLLRFSLKTAAAGRQAGRPLNIVLLLDNSGSMERSDRVSIIREALRVLAGQLQPQDKLSVITFARTARLVVDGISGDKAGEVTEAVAGLTPQGGTNLEDAMNLAYQTAAKHYLANGINRVVVLTDGAANLGNVEPDSLKQKVEAQRKQGIALDCFGIGWEGFNDDLLEVLSRNGDGRYGFINSPEEAATDFVGQLAGALKVAASDVKVQVEFNPKRVTAYRQIGYAKHQLKKEQFRDNTVDAAEIAAQEAGNALYTVEVNSAGEGPLCTVRVRYKIPGTTDYREQAWDVPYSGNVCSLEQASPAMRLAASAAAFAEWLVASPFAGEVTPDRVLGVLSGVPEVYGADSRPKKLEWMIRQAKSLEGK